MKTYLWHVLLWLNLFSAFISHAQIVPSNDDLIIVNVMVNQVARGEAFIAESEKNAVWVREPDFLKFGLAIKSLKTAKINDSVFVLLIPTEQLRLVLSLNELRLNIDADPILLGLQRLSLASNKLSDSAHDRDFNGFLNYSIGTLSATATKPALAADVAANVVYGEWILRSEHSYLSLGRRKANARIQSFFLRDDPRNLLRYVVGDTASSAGTFSRSPPVMGVSVSRLFDISPGYQFNPTFAFSGQVRVPTTAEIFVDGARIRTIDIKPGQYNLYDLNYFSGLRNVTVVLRDKAGNSETREMNYYFSSTNLAKGVHQFRYAAGSPRVTNSNADRYQGKAWSGIHRYGYSDAITIGASAESSGGYSRGGISTILAGQYGNVSVDASTSRAIGTPISGNAMLFTYGYGVRAYNISVSALRQSSNFGLAKADLTTIANSTQRFDPLISQWSTGFGAAIGERRAINFSAVRSTQQSGANSSTATFRFTQGFGEGRSMIAGISSRQEQGKRSVDFLLSVTLPLGKSLTANASAERRGRDSQIETLRIADTIPTGDGVGFRLAFDRTLRDKSAEGFVQWNHSIGNATIAMRRNQPNVGEPSQAAEVRLAGAVVRSRAQFFLAPPISQSFAVVDAAGIGGVRVYQNNQLIGKTNDNGFLLLPALAAYTTNQIRIDDRDIPLERQIKQVTTSLVPRTFTGAFARFESRRVVSVSGRLVSLRNSENIPIASAEVSTTLNKEVLKSVTTQEGEFYFEDLVPGTYQLAAENRHLRCAASIVVPITKTVLIELGDIRCETATQNP